MALVVYYSRRGHVEKIAKAYADKHCSELYRIEAKDNYSGIIGFLRAGRQAAKRIKAPIEPVTADLGSYDKVVVCGPVWAGNIASPIRTFLCDYGHKLNAVEYVLVSGSKAGTYQNLFEDMDELCGLKHLRAFTVSQGQELI